MKARLLFEISAWLLLVCMSRAAEPGQTVKLNLIASCARRMFQPNDVIHELKLDDEQPSGVKKPPPDLTAPQFAKLRIGPAETRTTFVAILDTPSDKPPRLFVDANHNGDFTDDPPCEWEAQQTTVQTRDGLREVTSYRGGTTLKVPYGAETLALHVQLEFHPDANDRAVGHGDDRLIYFQDFARAGKVTLDGKKDDAFFYDPSGNGDYKDAVNMGGVRLMLDLNGNGKFEMPNEGLPIGTPFNVGGTTFQFANMSATGASFRIEKSVQIAPQTQPWTPPDRMPYFAPGFEATDFDGKPIRFPQDFRGKIVLLHFWSTESKPCLAEIPNLVKAYEKFGSKKLEVLSVNLDFDGSSESNKQKFARSANDLHMNWPQICDGHEWKGEIAAKYYVRFAPAQLLIDGDTGGVLGFPDNLHGADLEKTIEQELERKNRK